ncbi:MAG: NCS2 family permease [Thermoguttaceae bacterium]|nr:NCS2 family permease [Thermoguttaceae bacterium]MBR2585824.1 NCS2 family permease [Thermoguttaceae bacterium]
MGIDIFGVKANQSTSAREIGAGLITFSTMAYIICVQPALMSGKLLGIDTGMPFDALLTTTCVASAFGTILMGLWARYPFALAPGMGENFYAVLSLFPICAAALGGSVGDAAVWQLGLGVLFASGLIFLLLSICRLRELFITIVAPPMKAAISVGIGFFVIFLGLRGAGFIEISGDTLSMGALTSPEMGVFLAGFLVTIFCASRRIPMGVLAGIVTAAILALILGKINIDQVCSAPASPMPIVGKIDLPGVWHHIARLWPSIFILVFMDLFDTFGTAIAVGRQGGFMRGDQYPRIERVFLVDATATMAGSLLGHSTVTCFVESSAGVAAGGRTGLTSVTVGFLFLLASFFSPLVSALAGYAPVVAPALVYTGILMLRDIAVIDWSDLSDAVPAFALIMGMVFTQSIANGILAGLILYPVVKFLCGKKEQTQCGQWILSLALIAYVIFVL